MRQGLINPGTTGQLPTNQSIIERLSYVQIDTISVTERAHHHVMFSRNENYIQSEINNLVKNQDVFEYWSHAAAYLPMRDYQYSLYKKQQHKKGEKHWHERDKKTEAYVLDRIKSEGALQSKDFEHPKGNGWFTWKPAKVALNNLFIDGSLMIKERQGFQKVFDIAERILPKHYLDLPVPSIDEYALHLIRTGLQAQGIMTANEMGYLRRGIKLVIAQQLDRLIASNELVCLKIEGLNSLYYADTQLITNFLSNIIETRNKQVHLLSPFDNLVIQRKRLLDLFGFDYQIECYVPAVKRQYGYYTIPILYGDKFVARFDAKADRKSNVFTLNNIWFEQGFKQTKEFTHKLYKELSKFSQFCGCDNWVI